MTTVVKGERGYFYKSTKMNLRAVTDNKRTGVKFTRTLIRCDQIGYLFDNGLLYAYSVSVVSDQYDVPG